MKLSGADVFTAPVTGVKRQQSSVAETGNRGNGAPSTGAEDAAIFKLMGNAMMLAVIGGLNDVFRIAEVQELTRERAF